MTEQIDLDALEILANIWTEDNEATLPVAPGRVAALIAIARAAQVMLVACDNTANDQDADHEWYIARRNLRDALAAIKEAGK